jgi:hypothetical protein
MHLKLHTGIGLIGAAMTLGFSSGAMASDVNDVALAETQSGMRVSVDPVTRQLRAVTAEEARALDRAAPSALRTTTSRPVALSSRVAGARGVRLGEEHMSFATASRTADGQLQMNCVEGGDHASHNHDAIAQRVESNLE